LAENGIVPSDRVIGVAPCGGQAFGENAFVKRWPGHNFIELIQAFGQRYKAKVLLFAGPNEKREITALMAGVGRKTACIDLTDVTLDNIIPLVERCELFIGNDTGPLRFANALHKKVIAFFGPVDEKVYGIYPFDPKEHAHMVNDIACRPCYQRFRLAACHNERRCLTDISVQAVLSVADRLLS